MKKSLNRFAVAAVAGAVTLGGVATPPANAVVPDASSAPAPRWQAEVLYPLAKMLALSGLASSFFAPQCWLLDTRGC